MTYDITKSESRVNIPHLPDICIQSKGDTVVLKNFN